MCGTAQVRIMTLFCLKSSNKCLPIIRYLIKSELPRLWTALLEFLVSTRPWDVVNGGIHAGACRKEDDNRRALASRERGEQFGIRECFGHAHLVCDLFRTILHMVALSSTSEDRDLLYPIIQDHFQNLVEIFAVFDHQLICNATAIPYLRVVRLC